MEGGLVLTSEAILPLIHWFLDGRTDYCLIHHPRRPSDARARLSRSLPHGRPSFGCHASYRILISKALGKFYMFQECHAGGHCTGQRKAFIAMFIVELLNNMRIILPEMTSNRGEGCIAGWVEGDLKLLFLRRMLQSGGCAGRSANSSHLMTFCGSNTDVRFLL